MSGIAILFLLLNAGALLMLPRRWAPLPLLVGACYMTLGQQIVIGPFHFTVIRVLVFVGLVRVLARGERIGGGIVGLDKVLLVWGAWNLLSSCFHNLPGEALVFRMGVVYGTLGIYFLVRVFCQNMEDAVQVIKITAYTLGPVALEMVLEHVTGRNIFAIMGGVPESVTVRGERMRAQGPFAHPILAGTIGAVCLPLMIGIWKKHPRSAKLGALSCLTIVATSNSSGPLMSVGFGMLALYSWRWRHLTRRIQIAAVVGYILLNAVMKSPAYYLIARIDLTGSSTGWHRARLIQSSIEHLREWWFAGTDVTRHWMPTGVSWSEAHTDITNYYLQFGVWSGMPSLLLLVYAVWVAFSYVGQMMRTSLQKSDFTVWAIGSGLFAHAASCISVSYFDQSFVFFYLTLAILASLKAASLFEEPHALHGEGVVNSLEESDFRIPALVT